MLNHQNSRGSFYISENSQRTLTPVSLKDDVQQPHGHSSGHVVHRGSRSTRMHRKRMRNLSLNFKGRTDSHNTHSDQSPSSKSLKKPRTAKAAPPLDDYKCAQDEVQHMEQTCTCGDSKQGTLKLDATGFLPKQRSQSSNSQGTGKNRVVFVVRNEESREDEPDSPGVHTGSKNNYDLAHLPKYDLAESEVSAEKKEKDPKVKPILLENDASVPTVVNGTPIRESPPMPIVTRKTVVEAGQEAANLKKSIS